MKILTWISRILFGGVFIFAGFTKAIDPLGSAYKFEDYFIAFGMEGLFPLALPLAIILNSFELLVGFTILLGLKMRISSWVGLLFMVFFTPLTLYIAINNPVPDCGCFGDAVIISNWDTFYKNIIILIAALIIFSQRNRIKPLWSHKKDWILVGGIAIMIIALSLYSLFNLPPMDFRPWKVGNDMKEQLSTIQEKKLNINLLTKIKKPGS
ncbi:MAG: DoxX family protein [Bacteroidales bacterium]|nr:DoxX family protein [Bacteroidales bacterium]